MNPCDLTWVDDHLAIGAAFGQVHLAELRAASIRRVVDLRAEACDDAGVLSACGIELLHLPTQDQAPIAPLALDMGVAWVCEALERGDRALVHCQHGVGRSATLACCVMVERGLDLPTALRRLKQVRCQVSPNPQQLAAVLEWAKRRVRTRPETDVPEPTWDELAAIIYAPET